LATSRKISRWFDVHEDEVGLFLWTVVLLFLIRSSGIFLNNYAEMAFLKRYGVEYMPVVNMVNAVATFFVMGVMTGFMTRLPGARLLARLFVFCGLSVAGIRASIPLGIDLIYPVLFMLKSQYEVLLALLFWNLANDLFNTRQSKRIFPLVTAGGVIGQILGSFVTPLVARWMHIDNLLIIYTMTTLAGAWVVQAMGRRYPTLLFRQQKDGEEKDRESIVDEFKTLLPLMKSSVLLKILVALTFLPNVLIPIMNYQFNYAVNEQFATESGLIDFFGYFRGVLNIVSLVILLFVGKLYDRFGLPVALMFHPFNYMLVFITFLLRFDAVAAVYARMSSNIIRSTINIPAKAVVTGLFPESYRAMIRPFLRGTVVRIGLFLGSGLILLSDILFHPRYLSLVAMPFVLAWAVTPFILKRRYNGILLNLIEEENVDFSAMDTDELRQVFQDKNVQDNLVQRFKRESGGDRLWVGRLLKSIAVNDLDDHLLDALREEQDTDTRIELIELLSDQAGPAAADAFSELINTQTPALATAMIEAGHRMSPETFAAFNRHIYEASALPRVIKARAVGSLYTVDQDRYGPIIDAWLASDDADLCRAGIIAAGVCRDNRFADPLKSFLAGAADDDSTLTLVLESLRAVNLPGLNPLVAEQLKNPKTRIRRAALNGYRIEDEGSLKTVIPMLGDQSKAIARLACEKIRTADYQNSLRLIKSLALPRRRVRASILDLLKEMAVKDLDVFRFVQFQARTCFQLVVQAQGVRRLSDGDLQQLLFVHLDERVWSALQTTLQVLGAQDRSGRMRRIARGILSNDKRQRANGLEAMDNILDKNLVRLLMPLLDDLDADARIAAGKRLFPADVKEPSTPDLFKNLLESRNWVTLTLALTLMQQTGEAAQSTERIDALSQHPNRLVSQAAGQLMQEKPDGMPATEQDMETASIPLTDKILHLKKIEIFGDLSINELAAVASVAEEAAFEEGEQVFIEGERGDTLYLVLNGDVAVIKDCNTGKEIELDSIGPGEYFGEMALFAGDRRSTTIRVKKTARFLTLHRQELQEIVSEYPQIALHACRVLSMRIRRLHAKIPDQSC
jgi:hypothetical protein